MRLCGLRGALAASRSVDRWVLHDPRMWLGTAFHKVMEAARWPTEIRPSAEDTWAEAISVAAASAALHPLDARFAAPERWPGYFLVRQRALSSAQSAVASGGGTRPASFLPGVGSPTERAMQARGGRLFGRPDRFDGRVLTEYKSSMPDPAWPGSEAVLDGFQRQLRLYAAIIAEETGSWPTEGRVVAASGQTLTVSLVPSACDAEAAAALAALDDLNRSIAAGDTPEAIARPAEGSCGGCPFQAVCPAFWRWLRAAGAGGLPSVAAAGVLDRLEPGQDGDLYTAFVVIDQPSMPSGTQPIALRRTIHGDLSASPRGTHLRIVSAKLKPDGRLRADLSTCVFVLDGLPSIATADGSAASTPLQPAQGG